ncbi:MAG: molecular chaperone TorD family protein [Candidatus Omnitrophica bacterium]|nr:molecular chaperone TorD family protein [Candidatus Omnitrophota bacterium]
MFLRPEEKAGIYFLFSRLFREAPDPGLINEILERTDGTGKEEEIAVEYASLFVVPGECRVSPYESFYCDSLTVDTSTADSPYFQAGCRLGGMKGFLYGVSAAAVEKAYRENGFEVDPRFYDLPDHIACELEFVGRLYERGRDEAARAFIHRHLGRWVSLFLTELEKQKRSIFYKRAARKLISFLTPEGALEGKAVEKGGMSECVPAKR